MNVVADLSESPSRHRTGKWAPLARRLGLPTIGRLLGRAFGMRGRIRIRENDRALVDPRMASITCWLNALATVLTPMIVVGDRFDRLGEVRDRRVLMRVRFLKSARSRAWIRLIRLHRTARSGARGLGVPPSTPSFGLTGPIPTPADPAERKVCSESFPPVMRSAPRIRPAPPPPCPGYRR